MGGYLDKNTVMKQWSSLPKTWCSIHQWQRTNASGCIEWIAEWIEMALPKIRFATDDLRQQSFRVQDHRGQIPRQTGIEQLTEKLLLRAIFNLSQVSILGEVIDYEVPIRRTNYARNADIDLLCVQSSSALCVEAKLPISRDSFLKVILQAFTYTSLIAIRRNTLLADFGLPVTLRLTPAVLTFANAQSGRQLKKCETFPNVLRLIGTLNSKLAEDGMNPLRFFVIENDDKDVNKCVTTAAQPNGDDKAVFRDGFALNIVEYAIPVSVPGGQGRTGIAE